MSTFFPTNISLTTPTHYHCPYLAEVLQWGHVYLTSAVLRGSVAAAVLNIVLSVSTASSNALVMCSILLNKRFRENSFMILLASMSLTDFLVGVTVQPLHVASRTCEILNRPELVCKLRAACQVSGVTLLSTSLGHVGFISLERYLAVRFPTLYRSFLSARRTVVGVTILWLLFLTYAILPVAGYRQVGSLTGRSLSWASSLQPPLLVTVEPSSTLAQAVAHAYSTQAASLWQLCGKKRKENQLAKTMLYTVGILFLCYLPQMIAYPMVTLYPKKVHLVWIGLNWTHTVLYSNSLINPFWYCWRITELRRAVLSRAGFESKASAEENSN